MSNDMQTALAKLSEGDMNALDEVYGFLSVRVFNYARSITQNKEMAEDIAHDVFMQIIKQASRLAKMADPAAYIMVTTRNKALDRIKRDKHRTIPIEDVPEIGATSSAHEQMFIEEAFSQLPANQRETVYLHYICGFTKSEVSKIIGVPLATVKWRYSKAMSQLQAYYIQDKGEKHYEIT